MFRLRPNIGLMNAYIRLICGFFMLGWGTAKIIKRPFSNMPFFIVLMGAVKLAEGITRFCPITYIAQEKIDQFIHDDDYDHESEELINPS